MKHYLKATFPILFSFQIKSTVHEISQKTIGYKMIGIMILVISAGSINPHATLDFIYQLQPVQQANVVAFIFCAYLLFSAMFNQKIVVSPQLLYIRQLPIDYKLLFWSHIASLSILNLFFIGACVYALWVASSWFALSWLQMAVLLTSGILGLAMGQIHYTCSRAKSRMSALFSLSGFYLFICGLWYAVVISDQTTGSSNIVIFAGSAAVLVCGYLISRQTVDRLGMVSPSAIPLFSCGLLLKNLRGLTGLVSIDYVALWRLKKRELISRMVAAVLSLIYAIVAEINNSWGHTDGNHLFLMSGAFLAFLLVNRLMISNRDFRKQAPWIRDILPFNRQNLCFAEYLSFFLAFLPITLIYTFAAVWLFNMLAIDVFVLGGLVALYIAMLSASACLLLYSKVSERWGLFLQLLVGIICIVVYCYSVMAFMLLCLLFHVAFVFSVLSLAKKTTPL